MVINREQLTLEWKRQICIQGRGSVEKLIDEILIWLIKEAH